MGVAPSLAALGRLPTDTIPRPPAASRHVAAGECGQAQKSEMRSRVTADG